MTTRDDYFTTASGRRLYILNPDPEQICIDDIAHALANICRFGGMSKVFFSVAQHSVMVSHLVPPEHALAGLLHDAAEAYIGDVIRPLKQLLFDYRAIEKRWERAISRHFGVDLVMKDRSIRIADGRALLVERMHLIPDSLADWVEDQAGLTPAGWWEDPLSPAEAKQAFLARFHELTEVQSAA